MQNPYKSRQRRYIPAVALRMQTDEDGGRHLEGVAPAWGVRSVDLGNWVEVFERGAFGDVGKLGDIRCTFEHSGLAILGRTEAGTLEIEDSDEGLRYRVSLPDTQAARDLGVLVERGDVRGSSFEFRAKEIDEEKLDDGRTLVRVREAQLFQVGPVTDPAYPDGPSVELRSIGEWLDSRGQRVTDDDLRRARQRALMMGA